LYAVKNSKTFSAVLSNTCDLATSTLDLILGMGAATSTFASALSIAVLLQAGPVATRL